MDQKVELKYNYIDKELYYKKVELSKFLEELQETKTELTADGWENICINFEASDDRFFIYLSGKRLETLVEATARVEREKAKTDRIKKQELDILADLKKKYESTE